MNLLITRSVIAIFLHDPGLIAHVFRPMFRLVEHPWQMLPVGFLLVSVTPRRRKSACRRRRDGDWEGPSVSLILALPVLFSANLSTIVGPVIGGIDTLAPVGSELDLKGWFWDRMGDLDDDFGLLGLSIIGIGAMSWLVSLVGSRVRRMDRIEIRSA